MGLVAVAAFSDLPAAQVAASALRSSGMLVHIQSEVWGSMMPHLQQASGCFRIMVPEEDAKDARAFLKSIPPRPAHIQGGTVQAVAATCLWLAGFDIIGLMVPIFRRRRPLHDEDPDSEPNG